MEGKVLLLEKWHEGFNPKDEESKLIPVWVQVPGLPLQAWDEDVIKSMAGAIGKLVAIDTATKNKTRLIHARFCVLVRSNETVPSCVELKMGDKVWEQELIYEDSRTRCTKCRRGYHIPQKCPGKDEEEKKGEPKKKWVPKRQEKGAEDKEEEQGEGKTDGVEKLKEPAEEEHKEQKDEEKTTEVETRESQENEEEQEKEEEKEAEQQEQASKEESAEEEVEEFEKVQTRRSRRRQEGGKMDVGSEEKKMGRPTDKERREKEAASQIDMGIQKTLDSVRGRGKPKK